MNVRELLKKQDAGFISLNEVLVRMTQIDGATYQEAATLLFRLIQPVSLQDEFSMWRIADKLNGAMKASYSDESSALECLKMAASHSLDSYEWTGDENSIPF